MDKNKISKYPEYNLEQQMAKLDMVRAICNEPSFVLQSKLDAVTKLIAAEETILNKEKGLLRSAVLDGANSLLRSLQAPMLPMNFFLPAALDADADEEPASASAPTTPRV